MIVIKVWCLPPNQSEDRLNHLYQKIIQAVVSVPEIPNKPEDIVCLFPPDLMKYGLGKEIIVEVTGIPIYANVKDCFNLADSIKKSISLIYSSAKIQCTVEEFNHQKRGC